VTVPIWTAARAAPRCMPAAISPRRRRCRGVR